MPDYAAQVAPADRWAIAAYIRVLQRSQHASVGDLTPTERGRLDRGERPRAAERESVRPASPKRPNSTARHPGRRA